MLRGLLWVLICIRADHTAVYIYLSRSPLASREWSWRTYGLLACTMDASQFHQISVVVGLGVVFFYEAVQICIAQVWTMFPASAALR